MPTHIFQIHLICVRRGRKNQKLERESKYFWYYFTPDGNFFLDHQTLLCRLKNRVIYWNPPKCRLK